MPKVARNLYLAKRDELIVPSGDDVAPKMQSYISDHPTSFNWRNDVEDMVQKVQAKWDWKTYINTYWWHPPYDPGVIDFRYDVKSLDVWGGGVSNGKYQGYRGKALPDHLHKDIFNFLFYRSTGPSIDWILTNGWMWSRWTGGDGWSRYDPYDPQNADMAHFRHIHVTYV
jgi:hypothetical protein